MKVYHGSNIRIEKIDLVKGRELLDFGRGFYVTNIRKHAHQRAIKTSLKSGGTPVITEFEYLENYPANVGIQVKHFHEVSEEWVEFVIMNRNEGIKHPAHSYEIVEGPIANDWVTFQIERYQKNEISMDELLRNMRYREQTHQICFCTYEALWALKALDDPLLFVREDIAAEIIIALQKDLSWGYRQARDELFNSTVFSRLADNRTKLCEKPWQQIYEILKEELKTKQRP